MWEPVDFDQMTEDEKRIAAHPLVPWTLIVILLGPALLAILAELFG